MGFGPAKDFHHQSTGCLSRHWAAYVRPPSSGRWDILVRISSHILHTVSRLRIDSDTLLSGEDLNLISLALRLGFVSFRVSTRPRYTPCSLGQERDRHPGPFISESWRRILISSVLVQTRTVSSLARAPEDSLQLASLFAMFNLDLKEVPFLSLKLA